jgi:hypothetical protein
MCWVGLFALAVEAMIPVDMLPVSTPIDGIVISLFRKKCVSSQLREHANPPGK